MVPGKIVVDVLKKQVPTGLIGLAGLFKSSGAIDKAERVIVDAGSNILDDLIYFRIRAKS